MMNARESKIKAGDFTQLANMYAKYRPGYSESVLRGMLGIINLPVNTIDFADVGAGTGIWTRQVAAHRPHSAIAIEPNEAMRQAGQAVATNHPTVRWQAGSAEKTHLLDKSVDLLTMASSFHWADFATATQEFHRVLKSGGCFAVLWNPRYLQNSPLLMEIEDAIYQLEPNLKRVSSGKSKYIDELVEKLAECPLFTDMIHLEGMHDVKLTQEEYLGVWNSVNDIRAQLGEDKFNELIKFISKKISNHIYIHCYYQTRAWILRKK